MAAPPLQLVAVGHVDHGKSTIISQLLLGTDRIAPERVALVQEQCAAQGKEFEPAFLLDAFEEEQTQGVTIDTMRVRFGTPRRTFILIDAPGHHEFLKNLVTGATHADAALLVVDAHEGLGEQTRRHAVVLRLLGLKEVVVAVNKMDLCGYREDRFRALVGEIEALLGRLSITPRVIVPVAARPGENLIARSAHMPWDTAGPLLAQLEALPTAADSGEQPPRFVLQDVYKFDERRLYAGALATGRLAAGDEVVALPSGKTSRITAIERWSSRRGGDPAQAPEAVGLRLAHPLYLEAGEVLASPQHPAQVASLLRTHVFWMGRRPLAPDRLYTLKLATQEVPFELTELHRVIDAATLAPVEHPRELPLYHVGECTFSLRRPVAFEAHREVPVLGRFVIADRHEVCGGGIIDYDGMPRAVQDMMSRAKSRNLAPVETQVSADERRRLLGHRGAVLWFTGLSAAGKSTVALAVERALVARGINAFVLDGDNVRGGLCRDLGFSPEDRVENLRRVAEAARLLRDAGVVVLTAFISPYRSVRSRVRQIVGDRYFEVFVSCPLEECERRDPKGLYAKARAGEIPEFTGVSAPYEAPEHPDLELRTDVLSLADAVERVVELIREQGIIGN